MPVHKEPNVSTPLKCVLKALILALKDSADALVSLSDKCRKGDAYQSFFVDAKNLLVYALFFLKTIFAPIILYPPIIKSVDWQNKHEVFGRTMYFLVFSSHKKKVWGQNDGKKFCRE